jgi:rhomboid protease GluP
MFRRKTSGSILCPSCGRLTNADAPTCLVCGRRNPGMWGLAGPLRTLFRRRGFTDAVTVACIALYVLSLIFDPVGALRPRSMFGLPIPGSPSIQALQMLGAAGALPWAYGHWWTVITAIYLHGGLLHILFNVLWVRQLGPAVEEVYGPARLVVIFTTSGIAGYLLSNTVGIPLTVGASGSIFGLLGALIAYGQKRGGTFGSLVLREYGQWAIVLFIFGLLPGTGVNNWAHGGGFVGGFVAGWLLSFAERRDESGTDQLLAAACVIATVAAFALAFWTAFLG